MDNEKEILEAETVEKETIDAEVVDSDEILNPDVDQETPFDPNVILNTIMQSQDTDLRSVVVKMSTLNMSSKAALVCLLFKYLNVVGIALLVYSLYCAIYVLIHYDKVKDKEYMIKDIMSKDGKAIDIKKIVLKNLILLLICIPIAFLSFWYYFVFQVS